MYSFYTKPQYYEDLVAKLNAAKQGERVVAITMTYTPADPDVQCLHRAFCAAARRGAVVMLLVDTYGLIIGDPITPGPLFLHAQLPSIRLAPRFQAILDALEELKAAGGQYAIINQPGRPFTNPKGGRSHIKFTVIGDWYYLGGCNLEPMHRADMMIGEHSPEIAGWLAALAGRIFSQRSAKAAMPSGDITHPAGPASTLFVDAGVKGRSLIYDQALAFIDAAQHEIFFASQYFPYGSVGEHLRLAHERGIKITIIYNHPSRFSWAEKALHYGVIARERLRLPASFFNHPLSGPGYLHAKLIASEQGAFIGSHNYVKAGVDFGTAEIAMLIQDSETSRRAVETLSRQVG